MKELRQLFSRGHDMAQARRVASVFFFVCSAFVFILETSRRVTSAAKKQPDFLSQNSFFHLPRPGLIVLVAGLPPQPCMRYHPETLKAAVERRRSAQRKHSLPSIGDGVRTHLSIKNLEQIRHAKQCLCLSGQYFSAWRGHHCACWLPDSERFSVACPTELEVSLALFLLGGDTALPLARSYLHTACMCVYFLFCAEENHMFTHV